MLFFRKKSYEVKLRGRSEVEYIEGKRRLRIGSEFLADDAGIVLYSSGLTHWESPHQCEVLSEDDLMRVKANVLADLAKHKIPAEWD
jgi:hypothetical protein